MRVAENSQAAALFQQRYGQPRATGRYSALVDLLESFAHLPYENFTKILAWEAAGESPNFRLPLTVISEHLELGTGGTCFSLTELLRQLVISSGLDGRPVMAHMAHGQNIHCALIVAAQGRRFLVDPGYLLAHPLALDETSPHSLLCPAGREFDLFTVDEQGNRKWRYRFADRAPSPAEFLNHWRASFFQSGMHKLLATRRTDEGTLLFLHNHKLRAQGPSAKSTSNVRDCLEQSVERHFGIAPQITRLAQEIVSNKRLQLRSPAAR